MSVSRWLIQDGVIATIGALVGFVVLRRGRVPPKVEHLVWLAITVKFVMPPVLGLPLPVLPTPGSVHWPPAGHSLEMRSVTSPIGERGADRAVGTVGEEPVRAVTAEAGSRGGVGWPDVGVIWLMVAGAGLAIQVLRNQAWWERRRTTEPPPDLVAITREVARRMGVRCPRVRIDSELRTPVVAGLPRATLFWPQALLAGQSGAHVRLMVAHELAHLRRGDLWFCLLEVAVQSLWWWYPGWWVVRERLRDASERDCDARVMALYPTRRASYGRLLLDMVTAGTARSTALATGLASSSLTRERIKAILLPLKASRRVRWPVALVAIMPLVAIPRAGGRAPADSMHGPVPDAEGRRPDADAASISPSPLLASVRADQAVLPPDLMEVLGIAASDASPEVRRAVVNALKVIQGTRRAEILERLRHDSAPDVARAARVVLGLEVAVANHWVETVAPRPLTSAELTTQLTLVASASPSVRLRAINVLRNHPDVRSIPALITASSDPDFHVRQAAASALGATRHPAGIPSLLRLLADAHPRVRQDAAGAFWTDAEPWPVMTGLIAAVQDPEAAVRQVAVGALARLAAEMPQ